MTFSAVNVRLWLAATTAGAVVSLAGAQPAAYQAQAIIFSSPADGAVTSNLNLMAVPAPSPLELGNQFSKPTEGFNFRDVPVAAPPFRAPPPTVIPPANGQTLQDWFDMRNNWALMTPAEIFGVKNPKANSAGAGRNLDNREEPSTALERFLDRHNLAQTIRTNRAQSDSLTPSLGFSGAGSNQWDASFPGRSALGDGNAQQFLNRFGDAVPDDNAADDPNLAASRFGGFGAGPQPPDQKAKQTAEKERFQQLLMLRLGPAAAAFPPAAAVNSTSKEAKPAPGSRWPGNPAGVSVAGINSGISALAGWPPLPSVVALTNRLSVTTPPPAWAPKPPPWLSPTPDPFAIPQRQF